MKKQLRLVLFAVLVMVLIMASALVASAVTEGATTRENGHYYSVHTGPRDRQPKYYSTLENALASVEADGYTITVLQKATEQAVTLDVPYTYTIKSVDGARATLNFISANANGSLIEVTAGKVTFDGVNFAYVASQLATAPVSVLYIDGAAEVVLNNVKTEAIVTNTIELKSATPVTVSGDDTDMSGAQSLLKAFVSGATVNFAGGEVTAAESVVSAPLKSIAINVTGGKLVGGTVALFSVTGQSGTVITVSGGELVANNGKPMFSVTDAAAEAPTKIDLKTGAKIYANNAVIFDGLNENCTVELNGAEFYMNGASAKLFADESQDVACEVTSNAATMMLLEGANFPSSAWAKIDYAKITVVLNEIKLTTGTVNIASTADVAAIIANAVPAHITNLAPGWITIVINGATVNVTDGKYTANGGYLFVVKSGTLNLSGGELVGAADSAIVLLEGGTVNYTSTKMTVGKNGETFEVKGGTLSVDGANVRLPEHICSLVLAQGESARYYTSIASALAAITADGAVITIYGQVESPAWVLNVDKTYTIKGDTANAAVTFTSTVTAGQTTLINVAAGKVTLDGLTINKISSRASKNVIVVSNAAAELVANNLQIIDADVENAVFYFTAEGKLTISGSKTNISVDSSSKPSDTAIIRINRGTATTHGEINVTAGTFESSGHIVYLSKYVKLNISAGTFVGGNNAMFFAPRGSNGSEVIIANATMSMAQNQPFLKEGNKSAKVAMTLGAGTSVTVTDSYCFQLVNQSASSITLAGATLELVGDAVLFSKNDSANDYSNLADVTVTSTSGTVVLGKGAALPEVALDSIIDWSKIAIAFTEYEATFEIATAGTYTFNSLADYLAVAQDQALANFDAEYGTRFPLAELQLAGWIPLTINHADAVVDIIAGDYITTGSYFFALKAGTLNIRGATFTSSKGTVVVMEGGTLNLISATLNGANNAKVIEHKAGVINVTGGVINAGRGDDAYIIYTTAQADNNININGGTLNGGKVIYVDETAALTVNIAGGLLSRREGLSMAYGILLYSENVVLNISGGEITNMYHAIHATKGTVNITGGVVRNAPNGSHVVHIDGPVKLTVTDGDLIAMTAGDSIGVINISVNAAQAEVAISGGGFGGVDGVVRDYMLPIQVWAPIKNFNVTGGEFIGGNSGGTIVACAGSAGAVLNFSGDIKVVGYRNFRIFDNVTLNISGGTFTHRPEQPNNILVVLESEATVNISGGQFLEYMNCFRINAAATVNITGGSFVSRTVHAASGSEWYCFARITGAAKFNIGPNPNGVDPEFYLKRSTTADGKTVMDIKGFRITSTEAQLKIGAGIFNIENKDNVWFEFPDAGIGAFEITGGTFNVVGEGASLVPSSMDKPGTVITNAHVTIKDGALLPIYQNIDTTTLHVTFEGAVTNDIIIRKPFGGDDPNQEGYVLSGPADLYNLVEGQFATFNADLSAFSEWLPMMIDGEGVIVTLKNFNDSYAMPTLIKINKGTLKVSGGSFVAQADEKLFEVAGNATVQIVGGEYNVSGLNSYLLYIAEGVDTSNISVTNAKMTVGAAGNAQLQASFNVSNQQVTVNGMSAIELAQAGNFTIAQVSDITALVQAALASKFENLTVNIDSFIPLHLNHEELTVTFTGGEYIGSSAFMFKITAGTLKFTGGKFTNEVGDIIQIVGDNATVEINLPNTGTEETNGMYTTGRIIYVKNVSGTKVTVKNGRFVEMAYDANGDQNDALFVFDGDKTNATFDVENGYFEATRVLVIANAPVKTTIENGTFVSNCVVDGTNIKARPTNANMISLSGSGATLAISGGSFDNKQGGYVLTQSGTTTTITGGTFDGGSGWYTASATSTLTISNGTFKDTNGYANNHYMYLNNGEAVVTITGGTFEGKVGTSDIFHVVAGQLSVSNGKFTGSLFHITTNSKITVSGGTYKATGIGSVLFEFISDGNTHPTSANFNLTVAKQFRVENYATIIDTTMSATAVKTLLNKATYVINGSARLGVTVSITEDEVWESSADAQHFIKDFFGVGKVTFIGTGTYALQLKGDVTITIKGGDYRFPGSTLFKLYGVDLIIEDGIFYASEGGDVFYLEGDCNVVIGKEFDVTAQPTFVVGFGGNIIHAQASPSTFLIYNGKFYKGILNDDLTVTPVIDYEGGDSALFYFTGGGEPTLIICDGHYEATRVLMNCDAYGEIVICGGVFKSTFNKQTIREIYGPDVEYDDKYGPKIYAADGSILYNNKQNFLLNVGDQNTTLTIYGGTYIGGYNCAIVGFFAGSGSTGGSTFNFYGGDFSGGYNWFYGNNSITMNIAKVANPWTEVVSAPTFRAPDNFTRYGFFFDINVFGKHIDLTISDGNFSMLDTYNRIMFVLQGDMDVNVSGGSFTVRPNETSRNDTVVFASYASASDLWVDITITGGSFTTPRAVQFYGGRGHLVITGGTFTANTEYCDGWANTIYSNHSGSTVYIAGGKFVGNRYQYAHVYVDGGSGQEITIVGGSFNKGRRWAYFNAPNLKILFDKTATTTPQFGPLSEDAGDGVYIHSNCTGSEINFASGTFVLPTNSTSRAMFVVEAGEITFGPGVVAEHPNRLFQIANALKGNIYIKGGTYTSSNVCNMFHLAPELWYAEQIGGAGPARIVIEDGTFRALESSTMFNLTGDMPQYELLIKGGTFFSEGARMFFYDAMHAGTGLTVTVEGGDFSTTASRLIYLDTSTNPMVIKGGTFTLLPKSGNNTDNAIIYAVGKKPSAITIAGGTFIDQRIGNKQTFIKMNPRAEINFAGNFKMYVLEKKTNFFYDYDNNMNSMPITKYAAMETLDGENYYVCFGYYRPYGPVITSTPRLRPVLGAEGLTFSASIPAATLEHLSAIGTVTYGTLIFPTEYLNDGEWDNTTDFLAELKAYAEESGKPESSVYVDIVADKGKVVAEDGSVTFYASLINIKEKNHNRAMTGIAYIKVVDGKGAVTYHYATHVSASVTQDMRTIAKAALYDLNTKPVENNGRVYCYATIMKEGMYFSRYTPAQQDSLRKYLVESERMPKHEK